MTDRPGWEQLNLEQTVNMLISLVGELTNRLDRMEATRKGGRPAKVILVKEDGVCGLNPGSDSYVCPDASLYRRRQGCQGDACVLAASDYYKKIRSDIAEIAVVPE